MGVGARGAAPTWSCGIVRPQTWRAAAARVAGIRSASPGPVEFVVPLPLELVLRRVVLLLGLVAIGRHGTNRWRS